MTLRLRAKVLLQVWAYDFYDTTLSTEKQRRHMVKVGKRDSSVQDIEGGCIMIFLFEITNKKYIWSRGYKQFSCSTGLSMKF